jgi:hypothetical protein
MDQLIAALVGGFLAAGTGWFLQVRLEASRRKHLKQLLLLGITDGSSPIAAIRIV